MNKSIVLSALVILFNVHPVLAATAKQSSGSVDSSSSGKSAAPDWMDGASVCEKQPTWSFSSSESCEDQSRRIDEAARHCFLTACLDRMSSPEQVKQRAERKKRAACEQNAKNLALSVAKRDGYIKSCLSENEASSAIASSEQAQRTTSGKPVSVDWMSAVNQKECKEKSTWRFSSSERCDDQARLIPSAERHCFMATCLNKMSSPEQVRQAAERKKRATCEQNTRNHSLQGVKKDNYLRTCMQENEAATAIADINGTSAIGVKKPAETAPAKPSVKPRESGSCADQAGKKGLKGSAHKDYIRKCKGRK